MLDKLFGKKKKPVKRNHLREVNCAFVNNGKSKVMVVDARENHDQHNMICRNCRECE